MSGPGGPDYPSLGLASNPFRRPVPPVESYEAEMQPLFAARGAEVERLVRLAQPGSAAFVTAQYGGGKTLVVLEAMSRLRGRAFVTVYVQYQRELGFRGSLLNAITALCGPARGRDPLARIRACLRRLRATGPVVLAVEDLDRAGDVAEIYQVTHDVRDFLSDGVGVILTGQPFGATFDLYTSAGAIFGILEIPPFSADDFREMLGKYLRSVHLDPSASAQHPFEPDAGGFLCREMADGKLTPRLLNFAAAELLDLAESAGASTIALDFMIGHWGELAHRVVAAVTPLQAQYLQVLLRAGEVSEDTPEAINELGHNQLAEYPEVREAVLRPLLERDLVQMNLRGGKEVYRLTSAAAAAVEHLFAVAKGPPIPWEDLLNALDRCVAASDRHNKGRLLEDFIAMFLGTVPGFRIPLDGRNLRTDAEELDVAVEVDGFWLHQRYGVFTICECKNWSAAVSWDELAILREKLAARSCRFGIFIALNGVTAGFREKMKAYLRDGVVIALLTQAELRRLADKVDPATILQEACYDTIKYEGERGPSASK